MYPGLAELPLYLVICMFLIACVSALFILLKNHRVGTVVGVCMVLGGGVSNLTERLIYGHVVDWIPVGEVFVTNVADAIIVIGILICVYYFYDSSRTINRAHRTRK